MEEGIEEEEILVYTFHLFKDMLTSYYWVYNIAVFVEEDDVALYTIKAIDDPRTLNKTLYIRPPENILSQAEVVSIWEKLTGKKLMKTNISEKDFLAIMAGNINHIVILIPQFRLFFIFFFCGNYM